MSLYHVAKPDGTRVGPFDLDTINTMLINGQLEPASLVWTEGMAEWAPVTTVATVPLPPTVPPAPKAGTQEWDLISAFRSVVFARFATFEGRASRSEYWWYALGSFIVSLLLGLIPFVGLLISLALFIPGLAVAVRRLHDTGRSGWFMLLALIPFVGAIVLLVFMVQPSGPANKWGEGPAAPAPTK